MHGDAMSERPGGERDVVIEFGQRDEKMQAGCDTVDPGSRQVLGERLEDRVAVMAVPDPGESQVPVQRAAGDELREDQLTEGRAGEVGPALGLDEVVAQPGRRQQPAESQCRARVLDTLPV
jgi:hypothetical protein